MAANQLVFGVSAQASNLNPLAADQRRFSRYLWNKRKGLKDRLGGLGERARLLGGLGERVHACLNSQQAC